MTEIGDAQLELMRSNASLNDITVTDDSSVAGSVRVTELFWGDQGQVDQLMEDTTGGFDVVLVSDLLYIAVRDRLEEKFVHTLAQLMGKSPKSCVMLFSYEERRHEVEERIVDDLLHTNPRTLERDDDTTWFDCTYEENLNMSDLDATKQNPDGIEMGLQGLFLQDFDIQLMTISSKQQGEASS